MSLFIFTLCNVENLPIVTALFSRLAPSKWIISAIILHNMQQSPPSECLLTPSISLYAEYSTA